MTEPRPKTAYVSPKFEAGPSIISPQLHAWLTGQRGVVRLAARVGQGSVHIGPTTVPVDDLGLGIPLSERVRQYGDHVWLHGRFIDGALKVMHVEGPWSEDDTGTGTVWRSIDG